MTRSRTCVVIDRLVEAETVGDLLIGRVPQHHRAAADHHRHVVDGDLEPIQQLLDVGITVEVDGRVGMAVARQELLDAERASGMARPDEHDVAEPVRDQLHPAQDEGPHEDLAQLAVGLHERQQVFALELDHFAQRSPARMRTSLRRPESIVDLAGELPRSHGRPRAPRWRLMAGQCST